MSLRLPVLTVVFCTAWLTGALAHAADGPAADKAPASIQQLAQMPIDEARLDKAGIRELSGKHLRLFTDLPSSPEIDVLPEVFDQAFPQWCQYFGVDAAAHADWKITGFLIKDKSRFQQAGVLPDDLPPFRHGYSRGYSLWLYDQPSDYYRRHLLLHEGTHSFMSILLGGWGPPWYMEGMAELMGTHRWRDGHLTLGVMPANREETPMWGRIKIVTDGFAARRARTLKQVLNNDDRAHRDTEPYGWCWAAAWLLGQHPRYQARFRQLYRLISSPNFNAEFRRLIGDDWDALAEEWQVFVATLEYGHDIARTAIDFTPGQPLPSSGKTVTVAADRGWQSSAIRLEAGTTYRLRASGRYQVAKEPRVWWCEPNGVSIRYYKGQPLGILLGAVRPDRPSGGSSPLIRPTVIGLDYTFTPEQSGTLYLKINDSPAELADNAGSLNVQVSIAADRGRGDNAK